MRYVTLNWVPKATSDMQQVVLRGTSAAVMSVIATVDPTIATYRDNLTTDYTDRVLYYKVGTVYKTAVVYSDTLSIAVPGDDDPNAIILNFSSDSYTPPDGDNVEMNFT